MTSQPPTHLSNGTRVQVALVEIEERPVRIFMPSSELWIDLKKVEELSRKSGPGDSFSFKCSASEGLPIFACYGFHVLETVSAHCSDSTFSGSHHYTIGLICTILKQSDVTRVLQAYWKAYIIEIVNSLVKGIKLVNTFISLAIDPHLEFTQLAAETGRMQARFNLGIPSLLSNKPKIEKSISSEEIVPTANINDNVSSSLSSMLKLLNIFTNGITDNRFDLANQVLIDKNLTVNKKLTKIDTLMPIPPTASADSLGKLLSVSKQSVLKSQWWILYRKGEKAQEIGRRQGKHKKRGESVDRYDLSDDD